MPIQRTNTVEDVLDVIRSFDLNGQRRISFEYILFEGMNDTPRHIKELARILSGIKCRINIIRFHPIPESQFKSPDLAATIRFKEALNKKGILTTIRASRGVDIQAACGLLSTMSQNK